MIRAAIVEDTPEDSALLNQYIKRFSSETDTEFNVEFFQNGIVFLEQTRNKAFDIILMDIQMPYMSGMETAKKLRRIARNDCLIFVTNMANYALEGYSVDAMDFIVKPVSYQTFSYKFARAVKRAQEEQGHCIVIKEKTGIKSIPVKNLQFVEMDHHKVLYHTTGGVIESWDAMKRVAAKLEAHGFALCNSGYLVNLRYVTEVNGSDVVVGGTSLKISQAKRKSFMGALLRYMGE